MKGNPRPTKQPGINRFNDKFNRGNFHSENHSQQHLNDLISKKKKKKK